MSRAMSPGLSRRLSFPRVSGDEPPAEKKIESGLGFSPRERG